MNVLLATDGGEAASQARRLFSKLANRDTVDVTVCAVGSFDMALREASYTGRFSADDAHRHAETTAQEAQEELLEDGFRADVSIPRGEPATEILRLSDTRDADLIVLGTGRETRLESFVLGSTSMAVLHAARCGVLIAHVVRDHDGPARVLLAADGSAGATHATDLLASFADPARCEVLVESVAKPTGSPGMDERDEDASAAAAAIAAETASRLTAAGFRTDTMVERGRPGTRLLEQARVHDVDLVVAGSRGLGRFEATVLGSVSDQLVRSARATLVGR